MHLMEMTIGYKTFPVSVARFKRMMEVIRHEPERQAVRKDLKDQNAWRPLSSSRGGFGCMMHLLLK